MMEGLLMSCSYSPRPLLPSLRPAHVVMGKLLRLTLVFTIPLQLVLAQNFAVPSTWRVSLFISSFIYNRISDLTPLPEADDDS